MKLELPYGKGTLALELEKDRPLTILRSQIEQSVPAASEEALVLQAMRTPIGCEQLHQLSRGKHHITIIASDHTRPVPSCILMPLILQKIRRGNPQADITILIATGYYSVECRGRRLSAGTRSWLPASGTTVQY